jgi:hypothetical protein
MINNTSIHILFAGDTSIVFAHHKTASLNTHMLNTFQIRNKWFKDSLISLNYEKTQCVQFRTKNVGQLIEIL